MNEKHHLDAPNDETLSSVSQLNDHSDLSTLYPEAHKQWSGDIMSTENRNKQRSQELDDFSQSITKEFLTIGLLVPIPLAIVGLGTVWLATNVWPHQTAINFIPSVLIGALWIGITYAVIRKMQTIFYQHTMRFGPFLATIWILLGISVQTLFVLTLPIHHANPYAAVACIAVMGFALSIGLSLLLLHIWTTPRLSSSTKFNVIILLTLAFGVITGLVTFLQLAV